MSMPYGAVVILRHGKNVEKPTYVYPGHLLDLYTAVDLVHGIL